MKPIPYGMTFEQANRPPFRDTREVQDGYERPIGNMSAVIVPRLVTIYDPMSKGCQQHGPMGEAMAFRAGQVERRVSEQEDRWQRTQ